MCVWSEFRRAIYLSDWVFRPSPSPWVGSFWSHPRPGPASPPLRIWALGVKGCEPPHPRGRLPTPDADSNLFYFVFLMAAAAAKPLQSCPTLCDLIDGGPPGSSVPRILQARTLEWVAISFSNARKWKGKVKSLSHVQLLATPWTAAHQAPPPMGFSRQESWSGVFLTAQDCKCPDIIIKAWIPFKHIRTLLVQCVCAHSASRAWLLTLFTLWTVARQAPLSMGFSRQESWCGVPFPPSGDLPDPGMEPASPGPFLWAEALWCKVILLRLAYLVFNAHQK